MRLRELFEQTPAGKIVAVMPGGFHPFHPGHKSLYDWAVKTFGKENVYVAATNDTKSRPFPFDVKQKLASMAGVPADRFIQVKSPFSALSYEGIIGNPENTSLIFIRSEKDKASHPLPDQIRKSDGNMGYLISFKNKNNLETADAHGYIAYGPTIDFDFSGMQIRSATELRNAWPTMSEEDKHKAAELMYGSNHNEAVKLLDQALGIEESEIIEVSSDGVAPETIKVMQPTNPPKAPDATIPRSRSGHTTEDGITYKQDRYNENLMHVETGGGTYTFDGARLVKWQTPRIGGLRHIYDYVQQKIYLDYNSAVDIGDGDVNFDQLATYDMKGNLIKGSGTTTFSAGGLKVSVTPNSFEMSYYVSDTLQLRVKSNTKALSPEAQQQIKELGPQIDGKNPEPLIKLAKIAKQFGANAQWLDNGRAIPFNQGIEMMRQAGG